MEEILGTLITLSAKQSEKKGTQIVGKYGLEKFEDQIKPVMSYVINQIRLFETLSDLIIADQENLPQLRSAE